MNTTTETQCAVCSDEMTVSHSNYTPTWSEHHDNVVCWWCSTHTSEQDLDAHASK